MTGTAGDRLARLLALVPWLIANDGITMAQCATHFGVTEEQLERDLWLLVVCGLPGYGPDQLVDIQFWDEGVIHVIDPQTLARPLRLSHEEVLTLLVSLRMLAQLPGVTDRDAILSAAAKLEDVASTYGTERFLSIRVPVPAEVTEAVDVALTEGRDLRITYASASKDEVTRRTIRPRRLLTVDGVSYLEAFCRSADALRTFRLDRVLAADLGDPDSDSGSVAAAEDADPDEQSEPILLAPAVRHAVLRLRPEARWIIDVHQASALGEPDADGCVEVSLPLHSLDWGVRLVLSLRGGATVLDPPELAHGVVLAARIALAAYPDHVR